MKILVKLFVGALLFTSCASIMNTRTKGVTLYTDEPTGIVLNNDTIGNNDVVHDFWVPRGRDTLFIDVFNQEKSKSIIVKPHSSFAYWLNCYPYFFGIGFIIDNFNPKKFTYPDKIYVDIDDESTSFMTYKPLDLKYRGYENIFKVTPIKMINPYMSSVEFSYERKINKYFASQFAFSYILPCSVWELQDNFRPNMEGYTIELEQKYYFKKSAPKSFYCALGAKYLKNDYRDYKKYYSTSLTADNENVEVFYDTYNIEKETFSMYFKVGYQFVIKQFVIDAYAGLGPKYREVKHYGKLDVPVWEEWGEFLDFESISNAEGQYWTVNVPLNIKLGWLF